MKTVSQKLDQLLEVLNLDTISYWSDVIQKAKEIQKLLAELESLKASTPQA